MDSKTKFKQTEMGKIPEDWSLSLLKNVCVQDRGVQTGPFGSQLHQRDYKPIGTPIITVEHLGENHIIHRNLPRVSDADRKRLARYTLCVGDIVFSRVGSVDRRALIRKDEDGWLFSGRCLRVRPNPNIVDSCFLSWFFGLHTFKEHIRQIAVGATMPSLNTKLLSNVEVILPPLPEQRAIASILGSLDDKIEINRQMNATLEAIGQAIFKHWFVDFEFPNEDGKPYRSSGGEMVDSELGEVPEGWRVGTIDDATSLIIDYRGKTPKKLEGDWSLEGIPAISAKNIKAGRIVQRETMKFVDEELYNRWMKDKLALSDILMTSEAPLGELLYLARNANFCLSQRVFCLRANHGCCLPIYLYHWLNTSVAQERLRSRATGTTVVGVRQSELRKVEVLLPPLSIQKEAAKPLENCMMKISRNEDEICTLAVIRDTLLPKLMSGEIRVKIPAEVKNARS